jgi:hypothetical protein
MTDKIDRRWWKQYRVSVENLFEQDEIVVRASGFRKLRHS